MVLETIIRAATVAPAFSTRNLPLSVVFLTAIKLILAGMPAAVAVLAG
jgi:hypothetical protein